MPSDKEIRETIETLKKLAQNHAWFRDHEISSMYETIEALESILHYPR